MTFNQLQRIINTYGIENIMFMVPIKPIRVIGPISYKSSDDEEIKVPCKINEERYKIHEGYKITLESIYPQFGKEHYYQHDLALLIEQGCVEFFVKRK